MMEATTMTGSRERGFTMIEVMIAILLTVIAVIGMMALFRVETRASAVSRRTTEAAVLAQDKIEELRTLAAPTSGADSAINALGEPTTGGPYSRTWTVNFVNNNYVMNVSVSWSDDGVSRSVEMNGQRGSGS